MLDLIEMIASMWRLYYIHILEIIYVCKCLVLCANNALFSYVLVLSATTHRLSRPASD